ncbi:MAG: PAS domain S-box protein [Deltaproteobacteria bacterium]|nr:PAS domain S-box protein [Deltaproteobacteria bacterium]
MAGRFADGVMKRFGAFRSPGQFSKGKRSQGVRERILFVMILIGTGFAAISFIPGAFLTLREGLWPVLAMNTAVLTCGVLLLAAKRLDYRTKAWTACLLIYAVGAYVVLFFGFLSGGPIWLFAFGVMCGLLLGVKAAVIGIVLNAATLLFFVYVHSATSLGQGLPFFASWLHCLTAFGGFVLMNTVTAVSCSLILEDEADVSFSLRREKSKLLESKRRLEEEIVSRKEAEHRQRELARELEILHTTAMEFVSISEEESLYHLIGKRIREILGDVVVVVNSFEPQTRQFCTMAVEGVSSRAGRILDILGRNPVGMISTLDDEIAEQKLKSGKLMEGPAGVHEMSFGAVPKAVGLSLEKLLGIRRIHVIGFVRKGDLFGSAVIVDRNPSLDSDLHKNRSLVEAYVNQAALALLRNRFERELRESEERYRHLVNNAPAGIYEIDLQDNTITNVNDVMCDYTGYAREEFLTLNPLELLTEESLAHFVERGQELLTGNDLPESTEYRMRRKDGSGFWARFHSNAVYVEGVPVKATVVVHDITEVKTLEKDKRQLQESLLEARKMEAVGTLAGGIAHRFNNALSVVSASMDLLELGADGGAENKKYIDGVKEAVQKMTGLTSQLLAYARGGKYFVRIISLNRFLSEVLPAILPQFSSSIQVETDLSPEVLPVEADPNQVKAMLSAVLTNAAEAMEEGGFIRIACQNQTVEEGDLKEYPGLVPGAYIALIIEDNGKGMDRQTLQKIFDPFFTTKFQGRGLAMPAVWGIVKNHGGWIDVDSAIGRGTTVRILLPAFEE